MSQLSYPQSVSSPSSGKAIRRQPRGSINRRACQKCRQLKIKCDGDAEKNQECSNCDVGTCVYDKSPRKNRQVERLNNRVECLEKNLTDTKTNLDAFRDRHDSETRILRLEKQIQNLLIDCSPLFTNTPDDQNVFAQLRQAINESRCWAILLPVIQTLLLRLLQSDSETNSIISILKNIAEKTMNYCNPDDAFSSIAPPNLIEELISQFNLSNQQQQQAFDTLTTTETESVSIPMIRTSPIIPMTDELANLALQSPGSDDGSDLSSLSQHFTSLPNIGISSPLTPIDQFSHSGSEYDVSPVSSYTSISFPHQQYFDEYDYLYNSYGSNPSQ